MEVNSSKLVKLIGHEAVLYYLHNYGDLVLLSLGIYENENSSTRQLTSELVSEALEFLKKRHPFLRAHFEEIDSEVYLRVSEPPSDSAAVTLEWTECTSREEAMACVQSYANNLNKFTQKCLLWKCLVAEFEKTKYAIALQLPMLITDGLNGVVLLFELTNILNAILSGRECEEMKIQLEVCPSFYELAEQRGMFTDEHRRFIEQKRGLDKSAPFLLPLEFKVDGESGFRFDTFRVDSEATGKLVSLCKARNQKLNGLLTAFYFHALRLLFAENNCDFPNTIRNVVVPANLRFRYQPPIDLSHARFQILIIYLNHTFAQDFASQTFCEQIWSSTEVFNKDLEAVLDLAHRSDAFTCTFDLEFLDWYKNKLREAFSGGSEEALQAVLSVRSGDFCLSNIGTHAASKKPRFNSPLRLDEVYFGDIMSSAPALTFCLLAYVNYWNGEMQFLVSTNKSQIGTVFSKRFAEIFERTIHDFLHKSK